MTAYSLDDVILDDLYGSHRAFLPGKPCTRDEVRDHLGRAILLDGLDREDSHLILSTLPAGADRIYLTPLDKGLSGSKVFSAKFDVEGHRVSKLFVLKIGSRSKLELEHAAVERFVSPHIKGVGHPVYRRGEKKALLAQELAGLSSGTNLKSLKNHLRVASDPSGAIQRLLSDRLGAWYSPARSRPMVELEIGSLFEGYLGKLGGSIYPADWTDLRSWVNRITGERWCEPGPVVDEVKARTIHSPIGVVHGDLHSQNVLVDEREECWPIDFAWCHDNASPVLDFTMLECSLKFLAIPQRSDLFTMIRVENLLCREPYPGPALGRVPYSVEISKILRAIVAVRRFAMEAIGITFKDYLAALCVMTYAHSTHPLLNRPYTLASLQILLSLTQATHEQH